MLPSILYSFFCMKKYVFLFLCLIIFSITIFAPKTFAQADLTGTQSATPTNYELPYPGLLPDNPLYFLKAVRDRLISVLINDSQKKAEFNLLTSDKKVNAAWFLALGGKDDLVVTTLSKSNNYFSEAVRMSQVSKKAGKPINSLIENLRLSLKKHEEVAKQIEQKVKKGKKENVRTEIFRIIEFKKNIQLLFPQNQ